MVPECDDDAKEFACWQREEDSHCDAKTLLLLLLVFGSFSLRISVT
jgi:hypothetical protein